MAIQVIDAGGANRTISAIKIIDAAGTDRTVSEIRVIDTTGTDRVVYSLSPPMTAAASPSAVAGSGFGVSAITTNATTITPTGGTGPYTYATTVIAYDHPTTAPTAGSPSSATTTVTQTNIGSGEYYTATLRTTVTDSLGATATADFTASFIEVS